MCFSLSFACFALILVLLFCIMSLNLAGMSINEVNLRCILELLRGQRIMNSAWTCKNTLFLHLIRHQVQFYVRADIK